MDFPTDKKIANPIFSAKIPKYLPNIISDFLSETLVRITYLSRLSCKYCFNFPFLAAATISARTSGGRM